MILVIHWRAVAATALGCALSGSALAADRGQALSIGYDLLALLLALAIFVFWNSRLRERIREKTGALEHALQQAQQARQESEEARDRLAATLGAIPDLLFEFDTAGHYLDVYCTRDALLAAPRETLVGRAVQDVLPPPAADTVLSALAAAAATGSDYGRTIELSLPDGTHWFELAVTRKQGSPGSAPELILLSRDVSERHQAAIDLRRYRDRLEEEVAQRTAALAAANEEQQALFDVATAGIVLLKERIIVRCNRRMDVLFGYAPGEQIGQSTRIWYPDDETFAAVGRDVYAQIRDGGTDRREQEVVRKDGSRFWVRMTGHAIESSDLSKGMVGIIEDITEGRRLEERLRTSQERLTLAMEASTDGLWDWNIETGETYYTPAYFRMLGYDPADFADRTVN